VWVVLHQLEIAGGPDTKHWGTGAVVNTSIKQAVSHFDLSIFEIN